MQKNIEEPSVSGGGDPIPVSDEINENFETHPFREEWLTEIRKRREEYLRGEGTSVTLEEMRATGRQMIEDAKRRSA